MCLKHLKSQVIYSSVGFLKEPKRKKTSIKYLNESYSLHHELLSLCISMKVTYLHPKPVIFMHLDESYLFTS